MSDYICAMCGGQFERVEDETWGDAAAKEEYAEAFAGFEGLATDVVCDDCYKLLPKPSELSKSEVERILNDLKNSLFFQQLAEEYAKMIIGDVEPLKGPTELIIALKERHGK